MRKRFLAFLLTLVMVIGILPITAMADGWVTGNHGANLHWYMPDDGVLTIWGSGKMDDVTTEDQPWDGLKNEVVVIGDGVESIGKNVFYDNSSLTTITIPDTVTLIDNSAFHGCTSLSTVYYIGSESDWDQISIGADNDALSRATIYCANHGTLASGSCGDNLTWNLTTDGVLTISGSGKMIDYDWRGAPWCSWQSRLKKVIIEDGVTSMGEFALRNCYSLSSISIPSSVTSIGENWSYGGNHYEVFFDGSEQEWNNVQSDDYEINGATIHFSSVSENTENAENTENTGTSEHYGTYQDVLLSDWYQNAVDYVVTNGLMSGYDDVTFAPNDALSRGMIVQILFSNEGQPTASAPSFTDISSSDWFANAAAWANENGIMSGYADGSFGGNKAVTREQLAVILYHYAESMGCDTSATADLSGYADVSSISSYALNAMQWANAVGLVNGITSTTLNPTGNASRAQVAAILMRFFENVVA